MQALLSPGEPTSCQRAVAILDDAHSTPGKATGDIPASLSRGDWPHTTPALLSAHEEMPNPASPARSAPVGIRRLAEVLQRVAVDADGLGAPTQRAGADGGALPPAGLHMAYRGVNSRH
eukprot:3892030-Pyramimonas_sp.AAC.1